MITIENVTKSITTAANTVPALRDVTFEIGAGALFGVYGPAGSGKSTLTRLLGLTGRPDSGVIRVDGVNTARLDGRSLRDVRRQFGTVDPAFLLRPERTAAGNIATPLEQLGVAGPRRRQKVAELLDLIGLSKAGAKQPHELNEGQRRRIALARSLAVSPAVLLVDDPTGGLDTEQAAAVLATLDRVRAELGATVVLATADAGVVRKVCDTVAILNRGIVRESGSLLGLLADQSSVTARALLPSVGASTVRDTSFDRVADVVLIGHATVDSLLPTARQRLGVEITTIDGGTTRIAETPVARFRIGLRGENADIALGWLGEHGGLVSAVPQSAPVFTGVRELVAPKTRELVAA